MLNPRFVPLCSGFANGICLLMSELLTT